MHKLLVVLSLFVSIKSNTTGKPCTENHRPLVLVHGFLGSGDNFGPMVQHLVAQGYCASRCFVYDWNSVARTPQQESLDQFIDSVRQLTGSAQVDLAGHSAGGGVGYSYLSDSTRANKVAHYIHIGSGAQKQAAAPQVPMLNIFSMGDKVVKGGLISGAENIVFSRYDHFEVITADSTAQAVYTFITGKNPVEKPLSRSKEMVKSFSVSGKVVSMGENKVQQNAQLTFWQGKNVLNAQKPEFETLTDANGRFTLKNLSSHKAPYLIEVKPASGKWVNYFFPALTPGDSLVYLRTFPSTGMVSLLMATLPADSAQSVLVIFSRQKAIIAGRDSLVVNDLTLSTPAWADAAKTAIAWFLFDGNKNGQTEATLLPQFGSVPFMRGLDVALKSGQKSATVFFNGVYHKVPLVPASQGITLVVL